MNPVNGKDDPQDKVQVSPTATRSPATGTQSDADGAYWLVPWNGQSAKLRVQRAHLSRPWHVTIDGVRIGTVGAPSPSRPWSEFQVANSHPAIVVALAWRPQWLFALDIFVDGVSLRDRTPLADARSSQPAPPDQFARGPGRFAVLRKPIYAAAVGAAFAATVLVGLRGDFTSSSLTYVGLWFVVMTGWAFLTGALATWLVKKNSWPAALRSVVFLVVLCVSPFALIIVVAGIAHY